MPKATVLVVLRLLPWYIWDQDFPPSVLRSRMYPSRLLSLSVLAPQLTVIVLPPWMLLGTEMLLGAVGAVFVFTEPSSETKREEGSTKAGRMANPA